MKRAFLLGGVLAAALALVIADGGPAESRHTKLEVGLVRCPSLGTASAYDRMSVAGLRRAVRDLGIEGKVLTPSQKEGCLPSLLYLARRGYDLVLAGSALQVEAVDRAARAFPNVRFAILDTRYEDLEHRPRNVTGVTFAAQEAGYLAGYLAGLEELRRPGRDVVSSVGGWKAPPVDVFIAGYQAGARKAAPHVATPHTYARSFNDPAKCKRAALAQIAKGSGVVFQVAGYCGLGALEAAKETGVWGIGADADQSSLGPHILTSALKQADVAVYEVIRRAQEGRLEGGRTIEFGLREGGVGLGMISPRVPRSFVAEVERVRRLIAAGKITVPATLS